jgi:competence protein ComFC
MAVSHWLRDMSLPLQSLSAVYDAALAVLYPQRCQICGSAVESRHDGVSCAKCWSETHLFTSADALCWKCGALSLARVSDDNREAIRCGRCDDEMFTCARACGFYESALRASILELKRQPHVARRVRELVHDLQQCEPLNTTDLIVPVPLHPDRESERGFNQAVVLARELARVSGLPIDEHSVVRRVHTERHRAGMDAKARRQSVANAFEVRHSDLISGRRVLLIDDVFTTGATVSTCAAALIEAGADSVFVLTIARAK